MVKEKLPEAVPILNTAVLGRPRPVIPVRYATHGRGAAILSLLPAVLLINNQPTGGIPLLWLPSGQELNFLTYW